VQDDICRQKPLTGRNTRPVTVLDTQVIDAWHPLYSGFWYHSRHGYCALIRAACLSDNMLQDNRDSRSKIQVP
jgi:hypothetical protein